MKECIIALVDCDSFFVSCEQAIDKSLQGKPVCVLSNNDACVIARSREAKEMGIKMGMPYFMAKKQFPDGIYVSGNHHIYKEYSKRVMAILRDFSPVVEVYSIDEAFVELSGLKKLYQTTYLGIAKQIRQKIKDELDINVSIGLSKSKVLAKLACEIAKSEKRSGVKVVGQKAVLNLLKKTKVNEIWGIGKNTTLFFNRWGVLNCYELIQKTDDWLKLKIGKRGVEIKHELLGECIDRVKTTRKLPKSIQNTRSFPSSTSDLNYIKNALNIHIHTSCTKLRHLKGKCNTVCIMLKNKDFQTFWDKKKLENSTNFELEITKEIMKMLDKLYDENTIYRSCGITLEDIDYSAESQLMLFSDNSKKDYEKLATAIDNIEKKFGKNKVKTGFFKEDW